MLNRLGRDTLVYGVSNILVRGIQIVLIPVYSRALGSEEYGVVETIVILGGLVNLTVALEISQGMARHLADASTEAQRRSYASTALIFSLFAYGLFTLIIAAAGASATDWVLGGHASAQALMIAVAALAVNGVFVLVQDLLRWQLRPMAYFAAGATYSLGSASVGIFLVTVQDAGVAGVLWGQLAGAFLGLLVSFRGATGLLSAEFDFGRLRQMLYYSMPLVVSGAAVFGNMFIDRIVVRELLGLDALGVYGVAARFASLIAILTVGLQAALSPLIFRSWREPQTAASLATAFRLYCVSMVPLVGGLSLFSGELLLLMTGPDFHKGQTVLPVLSLAAMLSSLYIFAPGLFLGKRTGQIAALNVCGALLNLALALWLAPYFGMIAVALTTAISALLVFIGFLVLGQQHFKVPYQFSRLFVSSGTIGLLVVLGLSLNTTPPIWNAYEILMKLTVLVAAFIFTVSAGLDGEDRTRVFARLLKFKRNP